MKMNFNSVTSTPQETAPQEMRRQVAAAEWKSYFDVALSGKLRHGHLKMAAALGHREAQVTLGQWYQDDNKLDKAMRWLQEAHLNFDGKDASLASLRGICFALGKCVDDKIASLIPKCGDASPEVKTEMVGLEVQALEYYQQAGELNHRQSQVIVAQRLEKNGEQAHAVEWYCKAKSYASLFLRSNHLCFVKEVEDVIERHKGKRIRDDDRDRDSDNIIITQLEQVVEKHRKIDDDYVHACEDDDDDDE